MESQELKIKRLHPTVKLPRYAHATDAGMDLYLPEPLELPPNERRVIGLGIAVELPKDTVGFVWEKSSRGREGLKTFAGVLDEEYRGELFATLWNTNPTETLSYQPGTPIAQLVIQPVLHPVTVEVNDLSVTPRGSGVFGSTHTVVDGEWVSTIERS